MSIQVKYVDIGAQFADSEEIITNIRELAKTGQFILGPAVEQFESRFADLCGVRFAIGVNSGTDALILIFRALGIGPGSEVITVPNSFIATAGAIATVGALPVFVDVCDDYNMNPASIEAAVTERTKAILPVHLTGYPAAMEEITAIAERLRLPIIEDAAQAVGAAIGERRVGSWGVAAAFSLHPLKNLNVWGDGGVVVTNSEEIARKIRLLRNHGLKDRDEAVIWGCTSRLDTLQAIVALNLISRLEKITESRIHNAQFYDHELTQLNGCVRIPPRRESARHIYQTYMIQAQRRDELLRYLAGNGVETKIHYPIPIHLQTAAKYLGYGIGSFPKAESLAKSILTLPIHQGLSEDQRQHVVKTIRNFYGSH